MYERLILIHDNKDLAETVAESFTKLNGCPTLAVTTAENALDTIRRKGQRLECVVIHKDLGEISGEGSNKIERVIEVLRLENEAVRVGVVSGEFPNGKNHVLALGADFYLSTKDLTLKRNWVLNQIRKGLVFPEEIKERGKRVSMPD